MLAPCTANATTSKHQGFTISQIAVSAWRKRKAMGNSGERLEEPSCHRCYLMMYFLEWLPVEAPLGCHHIAHSPLRRELASRTDAISAV